MRAKRRDPITTEEFIKGAKEKHGDVFDYSKVEFTLWINKVTIICKKHGEFHQPAYRHFGGNGCRKCSKSSTTEEFLTKAVYVHGDKYDYSKVEYYNNHTKVLIICKKHGSFEQVPSNHWKGHECPKCGHEKTIRSWRSNTEEFIKKAKKIHGDLYDYSKSVYVKAVDPITIICRQHGEFITNTRKHLKGNGCSKCTLKSQHRLFDAVCSSFPNEDVQWETGAQMAGQTTIGYIPAEVQHRN